MAWRWSQCVHSGSLLPSNNNITFQLFHMTVCAGCFLLGDLRAADAGSLRGLLSPGVSSVAWPGAPAEHGQQQQAEGQRQAEAGQDVHRDPDCVRSLLASVSQLLLLHVRQHRKFTIVMSIFIWSLISPQSVIGYKYTQHVFLAFFWLAMANSAFNPLIYFSMNAK